MKEAKIETEEQVSNAIEWLLALLANDFPQRKGLMEHEGAYCCLGVARKVCNTAGKNPDPELLLSDISEEGVREYLRVGLRTSDGEAASCHLPHLITLNDKHDLTHAQIAKRIIEKPSEYLVPAVARGVKAYFHAGDLEQNDWQEVV